MADTTVKVDSSVRDRLATLATERGATNRDLVAEFALATRPDPRRVAARYAAATAYVREHLCPDLDDDLD